MVQIVRPKFTFKTTLRYTADEVYFDTMFRTWAEQNGWVITGFRRGIHGGHVIVSRGFDNKVSLNSACTELFAEVLRLSKK